MSSLHEASRSLASLTGLPSHSLGARAIPSPSQELGDASEKEAFGCEQWSLYIRITREAF